MNKTLECTQTWRTHGDVHRVVGTIGNTVEYLGEFCISFDPKNFAWENKILESMKVLEVQSGWHDGSSVRSARACGHQEILAEFYGSIDTNLFFQTPSASAACPTRRSISYGAVISCVQSVPWTLVILIAKEKPWWTNARYIAVPLANRNRTRLQSYLWNRLSPACAC